MYNIQCPDCQNVINCNVERAVLLSVAKKTVPHALRRFFHVFKRKRANR